MSLVFLVHGYSIIKTTTYGQLHKQLQARGFRLEEIFLGRYVSLEDEVEVRDLARAMDNAIRAALRPLPTGTPFQMLTHSTGALIAKHWLLEHYTKSSYPKSRLGNLVFLAGPHFGSRLAHHGRSVIARVWREGDVGKRVLNALELGSEYSWDINLRIAAEKDFFGSRGIRPYCVIGDKTSRDLLRHVSLAREKGSDEVVRVASGNLNFRHYRVDMLREDSFDEKQPAAELSGIPFTALRSYTHSGGSSSIMQSISAVPPPDWEIATASQDDKRLNLKLIVRLLESGTDNRSYSANRSLLAGLADNEAKRLTDFGQLQLRFRDRSGRPVNDYFVEFGEVQADRETDRYGVERPVQRILPTKAIAHIHKNTINGHMLTLFIDRTELDAQKVYGMRVYVDELRLLHYEPQAHEADSVITMRGRDLLGDLLRRHTTTLVDVTLDRVPKRGLFQFDDAGRVVDEVQVDNDIEQQLMDFSRSRDYRRLDNQARGRALERRRRELERQRGEFGDRQAKDYHVEWRRDGRIKRDGLDE